MPLRRWWANTVSYLCVTEPLRHVLPATREFVQNALNDALPAWRAGGVVRNACSWFAGPGDGQETRPRRKPWATAWARSRTPSLRNSRRACVFTVSSDR
jgi:hypothetical protein